MGEQSKQRLDQALVDRGLVATRARARDLILRGEVTVDGTEMRKPAAKVDAASNLLLAPGAGDYVSRGALKLRAALDRFGLEPAGRIALDVGASTGGFTEVLLQRGATRVYAVDNGRDQLHPLLRADPRVVALEGCDARRLTRADIPDPIDALVADVSFISLPKALEAPLRLTREGAWMVALIKPQFEADRARVPRHGIITDPAVHASAIAHVEAWLATQPGWRRVATIESPIKGGDGNTEFLIGAVHDA